MAKTRRTSALRPRRVTIADIAKHVGVSTATVSYALNNPSRVSDAVVSQVHEAVSLLGYTGNEAARRLRVGRSNAIALIVNNAANPAFAAFDVGAEAEAARAGHFILLANSSDDAARETAYLRFFESQQVAGIVLAPVGEEPEEVAAIAGRGTPVVSLGHVGDGSAIPSVSGDDVAGGRTAMRHLLEGGRRRPLFLGGPRPQFVERHHGAASVAREAGVELDAEAIPAATVRAAHWAISEMPSRRLEALDAIFAGNDLLAIGALHALLERGIDVPGRIALVGYDDIEFAGLAIVPLTTIHHDVRAMSRAAVKTAIDAGRGSGAGDPVRLTFPPQLVVRRSSGA